MNLELSKEEAEALVNLLDIAVKSGGLKVAPNAVVLFLKIEQAAKVAAKQQEPPPA